MLGYFIYLSPGPSLIACFAAAAILFLSKSEICTKLIIIITAYFRKTFYYRFKTFYNEIIILGVLI